MHRNKRDVYRGKNCTKKVYESLREHAMAIINKKNGVINKRVAGIIQKWKNLLYL